MICEMIDKWKIFIRDRILLPSYSVRKKMAFKYLLGQGLEIGALHHPLEVPPGVVVSYVDCADREENIQKFKGIDGSGIVDTDLIDDGFVLSKVPTESQDFIIANHLLEHSPNPVQALICWDRILKKNGIIYLTLPNGNKSFDRGRPITSVAHMVEDFNLVNEGSLAVFNTRNREHYREFVKISIPNLHLVHRNLKVYRTEEEREKYIDKLASENSSDAHYHVFTEASFIEFIDYIKVHYLQNLDLLEITSSRSEKEFVAIIRKN